MNSMSLTSIRQGINAFASSGRYPIMLFPIALLLWLGPWTQAVAGAVLTNVEYLTLPGNQVRIELQLSGAAKKPRVFATENPARIVVDLQGVTSGLKKKTVPIGVGPVQSLAAVQGADRTRVVVNLSNSVPYRVDAGADKIRIALNSPRTVSSPPQAAARSAPRPSRPRASGSLGGVKDIDFRRGPNGEGRVLISLPSPDSRVSVTEKGKRVVAEISDAKLPPRLLRRLDVTEFATPVVAVESRPDGSNVEVSIETGTDYEYLAYQADELFTLEFRPPAKAKQQGRRRKKVVYSGDRLSLNFQDIEVRAVLQLLADFTGLNLVASDTVAGNITLRLKNVPWDQALDIILKAKGLSMRQTGNVILVAPTEELVAQEQRELQADQAIEELAPLRSEFIQVNYARAEKLAELLKSSDNQLLTPDRGNVTVDKRTNTLLVQDTAAKLSDVRRLVERLDIPTRQVMIESRVVIANNDFARDLGVRFGVTRTNLANPPASKTFGSVGGGLPGNISDPTDFPNYPGEEITRDYTGSLIRLDNPVLDLEDTLPLLVNLPVVDPSGAFNIFLGKIGTYLLQLELSAMQREGRGEIISAPRVVTADNQEATIKVGQEVPYTTVSQNGTNVEFKEAALVLRVTPQITPDDRVIMELNVEKNNADFTRAVMGQPPIDTRSVDTNVLVDNGETVVLGGVFERTKAFQREQVPWLGDLPVLGNLFKRTSKNDANTELLIFVTPKILKGDLAER
jgi:type IV pilus assembly protein PilQ